MASTDYRELMRHLHRAALLSERAGERMFTRRIGIGRTQLLVLRTIAEAGDKPPTQQAIADHLSLTKGAVSRQVDGARRHGWLEVAESPRSRREKSLRLTASGRALLDEGLAVQREYERATDTHISAADLAASVRTLKTICELLEREEHS
jgi:DNA-binding MarR family transcriptional regulator